MPRRFDMKVVGIFGLGHSGSTLLERCLSSHEQCVGLGEVDRTVAEAARSGTQGFKACTCGVHASECSVWSVLDTGERQCGDVTFFSSVFQRARDATGRSVIIDSSKRLSQALTLARMEREGYLEFVPILLMRDYRSWATSRKVSRDDRGLGIIGYLKRAWRWMVWNERVRRSLRKRGLRPVPIWYEDFVHTPAKVTAPVYERADLPAIEVDPGRACQHALRGNGMRNDPARNSTILINDRWRRDWRNRFMLPLVLGPAIYNSWLRRRARQGRV